MKLSRLRAFANVFWFLEIVVFSRHLTLNWKRKVWLKMKAWRWARAWEPINRPSHNELQSFDSKFPPIVLQRSCVHYTVTPPCWGLFIAFEVGRILASWGMATQVNGLEQEDGRWNESSGAYLGEGKWQQSLKVMHSYCDLDDGWFVFEFSFSLLCAISFWRCVSWESIRLWNGRTT